jgi:hypothetical protein
MLDRPSMPSRFACPYSCSRVFVFVLRPRDALDDDAARFVAALLPVVFRVVLDCVPRDDPREPVAESRSRASSPSSSPGMSFFAAVTAAGTARPSAAPATTVFVFDLPPSAISVTS